MADADGSNPRTVKHGVGGGGTVDWSPDGRRLVYAGGGFADNSLEIYSIGPDGEDERALTKNSAVDLMPAFSSDGSSVAFISLRDGNPEIYVVRADGSGQQRVTNSADEERSPRWTPDGRLLFLSAPEGSRETEIYSVRIDGGDRRRATNNVANEFYFSPSPDGQSVVVMLGTGDTTDLWLMNTDGSNLRRLTGRP